MATAYMAYPKHHWCLFNNNKNMSHIYRLTATTECKSNARQHMLTVVSSLVNIWCLQI